jgi:LmbE family N-acetylglucosaminyl deacetylase
VRRALRVYAPGQEVEYFPADLLFIHAHPDDESLDFGALMAGASRAGKRVAVVLFTDGESGLDLYPQRRVGDIYPARKLTGASLAQVRVVEATRALSVLGAEAYVRLGLINRPYSSERDVVSLEGVLEGWGGEERLIARLVEIIQGFRPALVISPDSHSGAHEHFEHEAVGYLVRRALAVLAPGAPYLEGHLVCVDPYQRDYYRDLITVSARRRDPVSGLELRTLQAAALAEHITQRDAAVLGVARLARVPYEYYKPLLWRRRGPPDLESYLK